jgi:hypothetical protein
VYPAQSNRHGFEGEMMTDKLVKSDICRIRDDIATILMAVTSMKNEISKSDLNDFTRHNLERHMKEIMANLNFITVILIGLANEEGV